MDRNTFAACAVFALPLSILSVGCDAAPGSSSRSARSAAPAVLAELDHLPAGGRHRHADSRFAQATQLIDEDSVVPAPQQANDGAIARPGELRRVPVQLPVEPLDAPAAPEPEGAAAGTPPTNAPSATLSVPMGEVDARIVFPSGEVEMSAPQPTDGAAVSQPAVPSVTTRVEPPVVTTAPAPQMSAVIQAPAPVQAPRQAPIAAAPVVSEPASSAPVTDRRALMPWANAVRHTPEMNAVSRQAHGRVQHGFRLAERGALYLARAEFIAALQVLTQASDTEQNTRLYTQALANGLIALKESSDFVRATGGTSQADVPKLVASHRTVVFKNSSPASVNPMQAAQRYYSYAQEQLAAAAAQEPSGSMALFGLAKVAIASAGNDKSQQFEHAAQAMTLFQAALIAEPNNFLAANELGVLLAENGNLVRARDWLIHSVTISPQAATWQNLASVHARLGEKQLADQALAQATALRQASPPSGVPAVQMLDPETFARMAPVSDTVLPAVTAVKPPAKTASAPAPAPAPTVETARRGISDWLPWNARR